MEQYEAQVSQGIQALHSSHTALKDVVRHCVGLNQTQTNGQAALNETKQYALNALSSVAYQVVTTSQQLDAFLQEQLNDLEGCIANIRTMSQHLAAHHEYHSRSAIRDFDVRPPAQFGARSVKLSEPAVAIDERVPTRIDFAQFDNIGLPFMTDRSGARGAPAAAAPAVAAPAAPSVPSLSGERERSGSLASAPAGVLSFKARSGAAAPPPASPAGLRVPSMIAVPSAGGVPPPPGVMAPPAPAAVPPPPPPAAGPPPPPAGGPPPPPAGGPPPPPAGGPPPPPAPAPEVAPPPPPPVEEAAPPPPPPPAEERKMCQVMYDYVANTDEELNISAGELLTVIMEDAGDGWMEGQNMAGQRGLFPASYVMIM